MAKAMIPDGPTDKVRNSGGSDLFVTLAMAMGGQRTDVCAYALARCMANVALMFDDADTAKSFIADLAADAVNELELNWPEREKLMADAVASTSTETGHG